MKFISNLCKLNIMIVKSKKIEQDINIVKDIYYLSINLSDNFVIK